MFELGNGEIDLFPMAAVIAQLHTHITSDAQKESFVVGVETGSKATMWAPEAEAENLVTDMAKNGTWKVKNPQTSTGWRLIALTRHFVLKSGIVDRSLANEITRWVQAAGRQILPVAPQVIKSPDPKGISRQLIDMFLEDAPPPVRAAWQA